MFIAGGIAVAVPAVWLVRKARGSLVPTAVLLATVSVGSYITGWNVSREDSMIRAQELYQASVIVAAVLITVVGRLWRRTEAAPPYRAASRTPPAAAPTSPTHVW